MKFIVYIMSASLIRCLRIYNLIILFCLGMLFIFFNSVERLSVQCMEILHRLSAEELRKGKEKKNCRAGAAAPVIIPMPDNSDGITGKTRTTFIEPPCSEYSSEPLDDTDNDYISALPEIPLDVTGFVEEDENVDPGDIEISTCSLSVREILEREEPELFQQEDIPCEDLSSGLTFEQLNDTYNILSAGTTGREQSKSAEAVLKTIEGTEFFNFLAVHEKCREKVRLLMDDMEDDNTNVVSRDNAFDINRYLS